MLSAFHGLCMALADSVPGVSGGTIAFILGFYDALLRALHGLFSREKPVRRQSLRALLRFGAGWTAGMIACILVLAELFELHIYFMCSLFLGLSAAAFPLVLRAERDTLRETARFAPLVLLGAALVAGLTLLRADAAVSLRVDFSQIHIWPLLYLLVSGAAAVSAMILPGISGSALLLIAGVYLPAMHALRQLLRLDFSGLPGILALGLGAAAGAVLAVRVIRAALRRFRGQMVWLILGLMAGSLDLCQTHTGVTGHVTLMDHGTNITEGKMDGDNRDFYGTMWFEDQEMPFHAAGVLADGVLELDVTIGSRIFSLTGFPIEL